MNNNKIEVPKQNDIEKDKTQMNRVICLLT
jgi:hypothetical protein